MAAIFAPARPPSSVIDSILRISSPSKLGASRSDAVRGVVRLLSRKVPLQMRALLGHHSEGRHHVARRHFALGVHDRMLGDITERNHANQAAGRIGDRESANTPLLHDVQRVWQRAVLADREHLSRHRNADMKLGESTALCIRGHDGVTVSDHGHRMSTLVEDRMYVRVANWYPTLPYTSKPATSR